MKYYVIVASKKKMVEKFGPYKNKTKQEAMLDELEKDKSKHDLIYLAETNKKGELFIWGPRVDSSKKRAKEEA